MRILLVLFCLVIYGREASSKGAHDSIPAWIDTIAPKVSVTPVEKYQRSPLFVSFTATKKAVIKVGSSAGLFQDYEKPIAVSREGNTVLYFWAEDLFGNKTPVDSVIYVLDFRPPVLEITPASGLFKKPVMVHLRTNEPCRLLKHADPTGADMVAIPDSFLVTKEFTGYITAIDKAGNSSRSEELSYLVDTSTLQVRSLPAPGIFGRAITLTFLSSQPAKIYYTFDALAPTEWFSEYTKPVRCPYGLTVVRYCALSARGQRSAVMRSNYVIDTVPPKIKQRFSAGKDYDTLELTTKEKSTIRYVLNNQTPFEQGYLYHKPLLIQKRAKAYVKAVATDVAQNQSEILTWEHSYDSIPPVVKASHQSGTFTAAFGLSFTTSEPARIFYTLDGSRPDFNAAIFKDKIGISKGGMTVVRYVAVDEADNVSREGRLDLMLDIIPPKIRMKIDGTPNQNEFKVFLQSDKPAQIYYEVGDKSPNRFSNLYTVPFTVQAGLMLRYFGVDAVGNTSEIYETSELKQPLVTVSPESGLFNRRVHTTLSSLYATQIFFRIVPDTNYTLYRDTILLTDEGSYTIEYYGRSGDGIKGPVRRSHYTLDWTVPRVDITVKKKTDDSVNVFFQSDKNVTIYYTIDGTNPLYSKTTRTAANKFISASDRVCLARKTETKLAFYAEDLAGNQNNLSILDIFKPHAVPNVPAGANRYYNRILSVTLGTYDDQSQVFFERHGKTPTLKSTLFSEPITLVTSDTIRTLVVDASGYKGEVETFIYLIDLPPSPQFAFVPENPLVGKEVVFDASRSLDHETPIERLVFRWDFDGDGTFDRTVTGEPICKFTYSQGGAYPVTLEVTDERKRAEKCIHRIAVTGICPSDMVFIPREQGRSFCVDRYEWPNNHGVIPMIDVSWIRAKMYCYDNGKRLCSFDEWKYACQGDPIENVQQTRYPYGNQYAPKQCPTEGGKMFKSGLFASCHGVYMVDDMIGNAWEWVDDKLDGAPVIAGGFNEFGSKAQCSFTSASSIITEAKDIGFRCCK